MQNLSDIINPITSKFIELIINDTYITTGKTQGLYKNFLKKQLDGKWILFFFNIKLKKLKAAIRTE